MSPLIREGWQGLAGLFVLSSLFEGDVFVLAVVLWLSLAFFLKVLT